MRRLLLLLCLCAPACDGDEAPVVQQPVVNTPAPTTPTQQPAPPGPGTGTTDYGWTDTCGRIECSSNWTCWGRLCPAGCYQGRCRQ